MKAARFLLAAALLLPSIAAAQNQTLEMQRLADGVYAGVYSEIRMDPVEGNSLIVIGGDGVLVLDSGRTPASARTMIAEIRKLTDKPVRFVVNSHWHDDHIFGNQAYADAFPNASFVAHANTRDDMQKEVIPSLTSYGPAYWEKMAAGLDDRLAKGTASDGAALTDAQKTRLKEQARTIREFLPKIASLRVVLPTTTFTDRLTIYLGDREVQLLHFGPANTRGDVAVYLPREKILATGDMLVHPVPFAYGSFLPSWIDALKKLRQLEASAILPGHGPVMHDYVYLDAVTELLQRVVTHVNQSVARGLSLEETRKTLDVESLRTRFAGDDPVRKGVFADSIVREAVERTYKSAKGDK